MLDAESLNAEVTGLLQITPIQPYGGDEGGQRQLARDDGDFYSGSVCWPQREVKPASIRANRRQDDAEHKDESGTPSHHGSFAAFSTQSALCNLPWH